MKPVIKYSIIAVAWIFYLLWGASAKTTTTEDQSVTPTSQVTQVETPAESANSMTTTDSTPKFYLEITAGETGEYGKEIVLNAGTEFEDRSIGYFIPEGTYIVTNVGQYITQVNVYKNEKRKTEAGWEEWSDGKAERIDVNASKSINLESGYFINVDVPAQITVQSND